MVQSPSVLGLRIPEMTKGWAVKEGFLEEAAVSLELWVGGERSGWERNPMKTKQLMCRTGEGLRGRPQAVKGLHTWWRGSSMPLWPQIADDVGCKQCRALGLHGARCKQDPMAAYNCTAFPRGAGAGRRHLVHLLGAEVS